MSPMRLLAVMTMILGLGLAPVFAQTPPQEAAPPPDADAAKPDGPHPGDRWTYERKDEITGEVTGLITETIMEVTDKEIVMRRTFSNKPQIVVTVVYDHNWNGIDDGDWKHTPNDRLGIVPPLRPGKEWGFNSTARNVVNDAIVQGQVQAKVVGQESLTTKAGAFDAFKIAYALRRTNALAPTRKFNVLIDVFYAPAIDHWVRRRYRSRVDGRLQEDSTLELVDYKRKP